jgi:hypothetical protein
VQTEELLKRLRLASDGRLPPFFYLANCHGNEAGHGGAESSAAQLHRAGVAQVVGYFGPIDDRLSTRAEAALYAAIAEGRPTTYAVAQARQALTRPLDEANPVATARSTEGLAVPSYIVDAEVLPRAERDPGPAEPARHGMPLAWAQLVLYHRGPDYPLSTPTTLQRRKDEAGPERTYEDVSLRRLFLDEPDDAPRRLMTGFIGRRRELHLIRRKKREGTRVFVF